MIEFTSLNISFSLKEKKKIRYWIYNTVSKENRELNYLSIVFCSDEELLKMNKEILNHNYYTDILTFELNEKNMAIEGDIYISIDRVKENAKKFGLKAVEELNRVIIHGVLHLCGYKDKTPKEKEIMTGKENFYLESFSVSRGTK